MARGLQKIESQKRALENAKKGGHSILKSGKGLKYQCDSCKIELDNKSNMKIHWEAKHPRLPLPADDFASMEKKAPAGK